MVENFEIICVFLITPQVGSPQTIDLESLPKTGGETDLTTGSLIIAGCFLDDNILLTVIGTHEKMSVLTFIREYRASLGDRGGPFSSIPMHEAHAHLNWRSSAVLLGWAKSSVWQTPEG
jgi:hypothetical protein